MSLKNDVSKIVYDEFANEIRQVELRQLFQNKYIKINGIKVKINRDGGLLSLFLGNDINDSLLKVIERTVEKIRNKRRYEQRKVKTVADDSKLTYDEYVYLRNSSVKGCLLNPIYEKVIREGIIYSGKKRSSITVYYPAIKPVLNYIQVVEYEDKFLKMVYNAVKYQWIPKYEKNGTIIIDGIKYNKNEVGICNNRYYIKVYNTVNWDLLKQIKSMKSQSKDVKNQYVRYKNFETWTEKRLFWQYELLQINMEILKKKEKTGEKVLHGI